jgi:CheY-like chemotaxis protein
MRAQPLAGLSTLSENQGARLPRGKLEDEIVSIFQRGLRVLVAEDEPLAALVIEEVLVGEGHVVALAQDGAAALELAGREAFDVLLTDLAMPRLTGLELIQALRQTQPQLPVVVMTGFLSPAAARELCTEAQPPVALLQKPFEIDRLLEALALVRPAQPASRAEARP